MKKKLALNVGELRIEQFQVQTAAIMVDGSYVSDAYSDPCRYCPDMPITFTCQ